MFAQFPCESLCENLSPVNQRKGNVVQCLEPYRESAIPFYYHTMEGLTDDSLLSIIGHLSSNDLRALTFVSKRFTKLSNNELVWFARCVEEKEINFKTASMTWKELFYMKELPDVCKHLSKLTTKTLLPMFTKMENATRAKQNIKCQGENCQVTTILFFLFRSFFVLFLKRLKKPKCVT